MHVLFNIDSYQNKVHQFCRNRNIHKYRYRIWWTWRKEILTGLSPLFKRLWGLWALLNNVTIYATNEEALKKKIARHFFVF
jgi:hypothetical protein